MDTSHKEEKVSIKGWLSLAVLIIMLSGTLGYMEGPWKFFDFTVLVGQFGEIAPGMTFAGKGGVGARDGFLFALTLIPTVMFAMGLIQVVESMGALKAARITFQPFLKPLLGIPGVAGIAFVSSFTSSDAGSAMTKILSDEGSISDDERTIFVAYQYAGSAPITNTIGTGAPLLAITVLPVGMIILIILIVKIIGANLIRLYLNYLAKKAVLAMEVQ